MGVLHKMAKGKAGRTPRLPIMVNEELYKELQASLDGKTVLVRHVEELIQKDIKEREVFSKRMKKLLAQAG